MGHNDYIPKRNVSIPHNPSLSINNEPRGYNQEHVQKRTREARNSLIDVYHTESFAAYSPRPVNLQNLIYWENQTYRSRIIWDPIVELVKYPITGSPDKFSVQYTLFNVEPTSGGSIDKKPVKKKKLPDFIRNTFFAKPVNQG